MAAAPAAAPRPSALDPAVAGLQAFLASIVRAREERDRRGR
jgi:hypothetical protein